MNLPLWKSVDKSIERLLFGVLLIGAVITMPVWLFVIVCLIGIVLFRNYYEAPIVWCILELVFGVPTDAWSPFIFIGTISMLLALVIAEAVKQRVFIS